MSPDPLSSWMKRWQLRPGHAHLPGRNRSRLCRGRDGWVLLKHADPGLSLAQEAAALDAFASARAFTVPRCVRRDRGAQAVAIEWLPRTKTLWQLHHERRFPIALARRLGQAMAELHARQWPLPRVTPSYDFGATLLWPSPDAFATSSPASLELLARVQRDVDACRLLEWLSQRAASGELDRALHGDLRQPNVLVKPSGGLVLIDWDQAAWGDPASDVGTLLGDYFTEHCVPSGTGLDAPRLRAFTGALLKSYLASAHEPDAWMLQAVAGWSAVALLRNASVLARTEGHLSRAASHLLDSALAMLRGPRTVFAQLTGVDG